MLGRFGSRLPCRWSTVPAMCEFDDGGGVDDRGRPPSRPHRPPSDLHFECHNVDDFPLPHRKAGNVSIERKR